VSHGNRLHPTAIITATRRRQSAAVAAVVAVADRRTDLTSVVLRLLLTLNSAVMRDQAPLPRVAVAVVVREAVELLHLPAPRPTQSLVPLARPPLCKLPLSLSPWPRPPLLLPRLPPLLPLLPQLLQQKNP
jgi:hypothetical protein